MVWRIIGALFSLTFFVAAFSIWGDPTCQSISMHGGRFGIAYTCLNDSSGTSSSGAAWGMFLIGLALLAFNLWPFIKVWYQNSKTEHSDYLSEAEDTPSDSQVYTESSSADFGSSQNNLGESMRPTHCQTCDEKLTKKGMFCQHCGAEVKNIQIESEILETAADSSLEYENEETISPIGESSGTNYKVIGIVGGFILLVVLIIAASSSGAPSDTSQVVSAPTPTETAKSYSVSDVLAGAGKGFDYVGEGFAMKWTETSCKKFNNCAWVKIYSIDECGSLQFSLTFTDKSKNVVGKDVQMGSFGLGAGETGKYELKFQSDAAWVQIDKVTCPLRF